MTDTERLFFYFLRRGLWGDTSAIDIVAGDSCWGELFDLSCRQAVSGIVADGIVRAGIRPSARLWNEWVFHLLHIEMMNEAMAHCGGMLLDMLAAHGVTAVVFKGQAVAKWYPNPLHRSYGDIDLVIVDGWDSLVNVLQDKGIPYFYENGDIIVEQLGNDFYNAKYAMSCGDRYRVEFHPTFETLYNPWMNNRLQRIVTKTSEWWTVNFGSSVIPHDTLEFNLACVILHIQRHVLSYGIGAKQICDVAIMLGKSGVDIPKLKAILNHLGALRFSTVLFRFIDIYLSENVSMYGLCREDKDVALLYDIFMNDGYVLKEERVNIGRGIQRAPLRVIRNGCFWTWRSLRLFRLMPGEAFFFMFDKVIVRLKMLFGVKS